ncbi:hypothetical protein FG05_30152 [Fusarium graminearum]|nr:hypothetical protein FG05_30152 [Fusarium graminearum]
MYAAAFLSIATNRSRLTPWLHLRSTLSLDFLSNCDSKSGEKPVSYQAHFSEAYSTLISRNISAYMIDGGLWRPAKSPERLS